MLGPQTQHKGTVFLGSACTFARFLPLRGSLQVSLRGTFCRRGRRERGGGRQACALAPMLRWAMVLSPDGHESPAERKRRRERARYARKQESRGVVVRSQRGRPRRSRPRLARTAAAAWWASQIPKWERDFQRGRAVRAIALARRLVLLADVCMHAVSVLARARRVSAAVQAAVNSEAAVAAAVAASSSAAAPPRALGQSAGPLPPPGEWRLPPVLTWLVMEKWLRAQGAWRALACVCRATSGSDERAEAEREAAAREDAARAWAAIRADDVARLRRAFWPSGDRPKTEPREPTPRALTHPLDPPAEHPAQAKCRSAPRICSGPTSRSPSTAATSDASARLADSSTTCIPHTSSACGRA